MPKLLVHRPDFESQGIGPHVALSLITIYFLHVVSTLDHEHAGGSVFCSWETLERGLPRSVSAVDPLLHWPRSNLAGFFERLEGCKQKAQEV